MAVGPDNILLVHAEYNPPDHVNKVGGSFALEQVKGSDVIDLFMPGMIFPSDFSDTFYFQYRKVFLYNNGMGGSDGVNKVYGFNLKNNNIIKFAIEKSQDQSPRLNGDETIKNAKTSPNLFGEYAYTEVQSDEALVFNTGSWNSGTGQGIWLRMRTYLCEGSDQIFFPDAFDQFCMGVVVEDQS